jgi:pumilio RNA-binding family
MLITANIILIIISSQTLSKSLKLIYRQNYPGAEVAVPQGGDLLGQYYKPPKEVFYRVMVTTLVIILEFLINMIEYCKDHSGSRMVQKKYEEASEEEKGLMLETLLPFIYPLSKDVFGNYVIQKILDCTAHSSNPNIASQRIYFIMKRLEGYYYELSLHMYGCRVIQKALEVVDGDQVLRIFSEVKFAIPKFIDDQNGNHVIQKLIERLDRSNNLQIIETIRDRAYYFCTHQYGCRVIQKIFDNCMKEDFQSILDVILDNIPTLSQDQYGNYVIQHKIENQDFSKMFKILKRPERKDI